MLQRTAISTHITLRRLALDVLGMIEVLLERAVVDRSWMPWTVMVLRPRWQEEDFWNVGPRRGIGGRRG